MGRVNAVMDGTDILKPAVEVASSEYSPAFLSAIDWALEFLPENRPQSVDEWRVVLAGRGTRRAPTVVPNVTTDFARAAPTEVRVEPAQSATGGASAAPAAATGTGGASARPAARKSSGRPGKSTAGGTSGMVATDRIAPPARPGGRSDPQPKRRDSRGLGRRVAEVAAVVLIIAAMGAWYFLTQPTDRVPARKPVAAIDDSAQDTEKVPSAELLAASRIAEQKAATESQARIDQQRAREKAAREAELEKARAAAEYERKRADIEQMLRAATADLAADRLTTPADKNAFSRFRTVLTLDPANEAALEGLHNILRRYLVLAKAAANDNNFDLARRYLDKAGAVSPGAESIAAARVALDTRKKSYQEEQQRIEVETRQAAQEERQRIADARRATEEERKRLEAARLAAEEERRRIRAEREAEIERKQTEQEAIVTAKLEADFRKSQEIAALLASADAAFAANRLASPPDDNALLDLRAVLAIDPQNSEADTGIRRIGVRYVQLATEKITAYRFDEAESLLDQANAIYPGIPSIAPARQKLRDGRAAYDGRRPITIPPFRVTMPPVTGADTCSTDDPVPDIENLGARLLRGDADLEYVPTFTNMNDSWRDSGINKKPRAERLYVLGRKDKLDGALMYWYSAVGSQCFKVRMVAYLVDLQTRTVYAEEGPRSSLQDLTESLVDQFKKGRRALAQ